MLAELQKQKINRRNNGNRRPQFRLIVDGKYKGAWEKKAHMPVKLDKKPFLLPAVHKIKQLILENRKLMLIGAGIIFCIICVLAAVSLIVPAFSEATPVLPKDDPLLSTVIDEKVFVHASANILSQSKTIKYFDLTLKTYTVKNGDSLEKIAKKMNVDLSTLISFNGISNAKDVHPGNVLSVPPQRGIKHIVRSGESLLKLSNAYNVSMDELLDWNNLKSTTIFKGQELFIPNARLSSNVVNKVIGQTFIWPTKGRISSPFGWRISPITGKRAFHNGMDIMNNQGTSVVAARSGQVTLVDYSKVYGNYIIIKHDDGFQTLYAHLYQIDVKRGKYVQQNEKIGSMGSTGQSTGPHLHFSIYTSKGAVDPIKYLAK